MKPYHQISCGLYDQLEILAMRKKTVQIKYLLPTDEIEVVQSVISTFKSGKDGEFAILDTGVEIRLDQLIEVDGIDFNTSDTCSIN